MNKQNGFTLIELLITVMIIGVAGAVAMGSKQPVKKVLNEQVSTPMQDPNVERQKNQPTLGKVIESKRSLVNP
jgi:prepilin-type N-terminal cleavage/methylation domain-containing protein